MSPTNAMMLELSLVMSASHMIWGTVGGGGEPPPPGPVPTMFVNFIARPDCNGDFVSFEPSPINAQADLDAVAIYPGNPTFVFHDEDSDCPNNGSPFMLEMTWNNTYLRWEFHYDAA